MKVLYVTGACLTKNTSANMSHNGYIKGLLDNGCDVDIIMANDSWGAEDTQLRKWEHATYYEFDSVSFSDKLKKWFKKKRTKSLSAQPAKNKNDEIGCKKGGVFLGFRKLCKRSFYLMFKPDKIYPLNITWLRNAQNFRKEGVYDLVVSNSSPSASHKLVINLTKADRIHYKRWVQIWEDPWYYDLYSDRNQLIKQEEHFLLQKATEIYYVSPLTQMYQQKFFPDCAEKMKCVPLPFLEFSDIEDNDIIEENSFGYFGDYYSVTRNLAPFYHALKKMDCKGYIYGDTDINLASNEKIQVNGRVTLDILSKVQARVQVLVHLCNLKGGQIPGKIYHYSATNKPILFILDGTEEEQQRIKEFFSRFDRYVFCKNQEEDILMAMHNIVEGKIKYKIVEEFSPCNIVKKIL